MIEQVKICTCCGESKYIVDFPKHRKCKDGIYTQCKECTNAKNRKGYHEHAEERRASSRRWHKDNAERRRDYVNGKYRELKDRVLDAYGGKCVRCGFEDRRALCLDHVNGNGLAERKTITPIGLLRRIIRDNYPADYQVLCANCNQIKAIENAEIPVSKLYRGE